MHHNEIRHLHHTNDTLVASNQALRYALSAVRADHTAEMTRIRAEMAPGLSWLDPDSAARLTYNLGEIRAEMAGMDTKLAKATS